MFDMFLDISEKYNETANDLLDKIMLRQFHLMEDKMNYEVKIESSLNEGNIHLAKTRYIMGQNSVSTARLPTENSPDFAATFICESVEEDNVKQFILTESKANNVVNPLRWFGVLVPQNLHKAQSIFKGTINYVVECINVQLQIQENINNINILRTYLNY